MEDMQKILDLFKQTLQATINQHDLIDLRYYSDKSKDVVIVTYEGGTLEVNVAMDSGIAMIRDILRAIY